MSEFEAAQREQAHYQGPDGLWMVWFQESGVEPMIFGGAGAEEAARRYHMQVRQTYNCCLLCAAELTGSLAPND